MKMSILISLVACLLFSGCGKSDAPNTPESNIDVTLDYRAPSSAEAAYQTFYKPANGETGDPMPFYNEADKMFYMYFLLEVHSTYPRGGIYLTKTKDFAQFYPISEQILTGNQDDLDKAIGTGSCIKKDGTYHFFYTGFNNSSLPSIVTKATTNDLSATWAKTPSLVLGAPNGYEKGEFRDPCVYWDDTRNKYVMLVGSRKAGKAAVARFQSDDLNNWEEIEGLVTTISNNPQKFEIETDTWIPECPDIFKMGNKWYLIFSRLDRDAHRKTFYRVADNPDGPWRVCGDKSKNEHHETFDGLYLYAAKTVSDGTSRYISGWASSGQERQSNGELSWGGMLVTHKLVQQLNGKLYPAIPDAVNAKFSKSADYKDIKTTGSVTGSNGQFTISGGKVIFNRTTSSAKIEMKINASGATKGFGIAFGAHNTQQETYNLTFDLSSGNVYGCPALFMYHQGKELNFMPLIVSENKQFDVKIIMERQVCTMYVNGVVAFTNHISNMEQNPWMIFADEGTVTFSEIKVFK